MLPGGLAYGEVDSTATISNTTTNANLVTTTTTASSSVNNFQVGWTIGGGLEWAFANRWSAKSIPLHGFGNTHQHVHGCRGDTVADGEFALHHNIFRVGINYNFADRTEREFLAFWFPKCDRRDRLVEPTAVGGFSAHPSGIVPEPMEGGEKPVKSE